MNRPELFRRSSIRDSARGRAAGQASGQAAANVTGQAAAHTAGLSDLVFTITVAGETFGLPIDCVRTVFRISAVTPVPRSPPHIIGLINLRGKAVNAICLRRRLDLPGTLLEPNPFAVCIEYAGEDLALIVDAVHDVVQFSAVQRIPVPNHVSDARARVTALLYDDGGRIVPLLDIERLVMESPIASVA